MVSTIAGRRSAKVNAVFGLDSMMRVPGSSAKLWTPPVPVAYCEVEGGGKPLTEAQVVAILDARHPELELEWGTTGERGRSHRISPAWRRQVGRQWRRP